jgi:acyl carrier protein
LLTIEELLASVLEVPVSSIKDSTGPATLKAWTSLKHIQLVAALEKTYGVALTSREMQRLTSLAQVRSVLRQKGIEV